MSYQFACLQCQVNAVGNKSSDENYDRGKVHHRDGWDIPHQPLTPFVAMEPRTIKTETVPVMGLMTTTKAVSMMPMRTTAEAAWLPGGTCTVTVALIGPHRGRASSTYPHWGEHSPSPSRHSYRQESQSSHYSSPSCRMHFDSPRRQHKNDGAQLQENGQSNEIKFY